ncbi:MAG: sulfite exporter TauE/SafE family protein [Alphaproteobacteria bacterium]|jgi:uncharacterized membrane protein YfcA|nr:sulfite exporter TauE/SafE family protein [Thalassospira sp.]MCE2964829.1 sulfite exporter TauE/SafE family protein [Alphaproteobacteria bacterium]
MDIYFPIAEVSLNGFFVIALGLIAGFAAGLFGVGGGFVLTPLLIFSGVPPMVAVGTQANQLVASSLSSVLGYIKRHLVDTRMALLLFAGGMVGGWFGLRLFSVLRDKGQIDITISLLYIIFLGGVGLFMLLDTWRTLRRRRLGRQSPPRARHHWLHGLPFKVYFTQSRLYISVLPILLIGAVIGLLVAIMGIGGGFLLVPAMIYLLRMPVHLVPGTSLLQILLVAVVVTVSHAVKHQSVDVLLALVLVMGSVLGSQLGAKAAAQWRGEWVRLSFAAVVLGLAGVMLLQLLLPPARLFSWTVMP